MDCRQIVFSGHAVQRMFERGIRAADVRTALRSGELIAEYPDDTPYPSSLVLAFVHGDPLHIVASVDAANSPCYVITVYHPDPGRWNPDYRTRRSP